MIGRPTSTGGVNPQLMQKTAEPIQPITTREELAKLAGVKIQSHDYIIRHTTGKRQDRIDLELTIQIFMIGGLLTLY